MSQLFINVIGHNSSGKTTISKKLEGTFNLNRVSGDDFRTFLYRHVRYFDKTDPSFPNSRYSELNDLVYQYRVELTHILLRAKQSVVFDGSGSTKEFRTRYLHKIKSEFPEVKTVIVFVNIDEEELLKRLALRDEKEKANWTEQYQKYKKHSFMPPNQDEADVVLHYNQSNYQEIEDQIKELLL